jgi:ferritin-like metal-binding protein YciE
VQLDNLNDLFIEQLADLHSAETQLVDALPKMATAASHDELRQTFQHHLEETRDHLQRLDDIISGLDRTVTKQCEAMRGLIREGEEIVSAAGDPAVRDAGLIAAAQRVEHYEIAAYGTARTLADQLDLGDARELLDQTLDEESQADKQEPNFGTPQAWLSRIWRQRELNPQDLNRRGEAGASFWPVWGAKNSVRLQTRRFRSSGRGARTARAAISLIDSAIGAYI